MRRLACVLCAAALLAAPALAQQRDGTLPRLSPNASVSFTLGVTEIIVSYGAPSARGRTVFGDLVPFGQVWRAGANEATTITFSTDVEVEGEPLAAGTYGFFVLPEEEAWTLIFSRDPQQWGAFRYDPAQDALRVRVHPETAPFRETLAFAFDGLTLGSGRDAVDVVLHWADRRAAFTVATDTEAHVVAMGDRAAERGDAARALAYARYALQSGRHLERAVAWARAAAEAEESFAALVVLARAQAATGDTEAAQRTGRRAVELARSLPEPPRDLAAFEAELASWERR